MVCIIAKRVFQFRSSRVTVIEIFQIPITEHDRKPVCLVDVDNEVSLPMLTFRGGVAIFAGKLDEQELEDWKELDRSSVCRLWVTVKMGHFLPPLQRHFMLKRLVSVRMSN